MNGDPAPLAPIVLTRRELLTWARCDCKTKGDGSIPAWQLDTWSTHDIIRVHGL